MSNNFEHLKDKLDLISTGTSEGQYLGFCPCEDHNDTKRSLAVNFTNNDMILFHCFSGCKYEDIIQGLDISISKGKEKNTFKLYNPLLAEKLEGYEIINPEIVNSYFKNERGIKNFNIRMAPVTLRFMGGEKMAIQINKYNSFNQLSQVQLIHIFKTGKAKINPENGKKFKFTYGSGKDARCKFGRYSDKEIHITEGPEDAALISSELKANCYCVFGASSVQSFPPPNETKKAHLWVDHDKAGEQAFLKLRQNLKAKNIEVVLHRARQFKTDWLDQYLKNENAVIDEFKKNRYEDWRFPQVIGDISREVSGITSEDCHSLIYDWACEESASSQTPTDFFISTSIIGLTSLLARAFLVKPDSMNPHYYESPNISGYICASPGCRKTYALNIGIFKILHDVMEHLAKKEKDEKKEFYKKETALKKLSAKINKLEKDADKNADTLKDLQEKYKNIDEQIQEHPLKKHRLVVNNITAAALVERAAKTNKNILLVDDELSDLFSSFKSDQSKRENRHLIVRGWNGNQSYFKETLSNGENFVKTLSISVVGCIQPSIISPIIKEILNNKNNDGLIQRFQISSFPNPTQYPPKSGKYNFKHLEALKNLANKIAGFSVNSEDRLAVPLSNEAFQYLEKIRSLKPSLDLEKNLQELLISFTSKYPKLFCSVALLFEICERHEDLSLEGIHNFDISEESAKMAYNFCLKMYENLLKLFQAELYPQKATSRLIADKIEKFQITDGMSIRNIYRSGWYGLSKYDDVYSGLLELEKCNWLKFKELKPESGGRPSLSIKLSPYFQNFKVKNFIKD